MGGRGCGLAGALPYDWLSLSVRDWLRVSPFGELGAPAGLSALPEHRCVVSSASARVALKRAAMTTAFTGPALKMELISV